ncbi:MAG: hypothetical protein ACRDZZ_08730, partial [Ilumatobacteraceae bacterium]
MASELALEIVSGDQRASALAHVEGCASCQELVNALTATTDRLLLLSPSAEPPAGFERRVLAVVRGHEAPPVVRQKRPRLNAIAVLALAACIAILAMVVA